MSNFKPQIQHTHLSTKASQIQQDKAEHVGAGRNALTANFQMYARTLCALCDVHVQLYISTPNYLSIENEATETTANAETMLCVKH